MSGAISAGISTTSSAAHMQMTAATNASCSSRARALAPTGSPRGPETEAAARSAPPLMRPCGAADTAQTTDPN